MFQCRYCATIFPKLPDKGGCPRCEAPDPKILAQKESSKTVIETRYVYIPRQQYYTPRTTTPIRYVRSQFFGTLGYKVGLATLATILVLFVIWQVYVAFFTGEVREFENPAVPTIFATRQFEEVQSEFETEMFIPLTDSESLRLQENAINVAVLGDGYGARYFKDQAVVLDTDSWNQVHQVFGISGMTVDGTAVIIQSDGTTYNLNTYQGFILASNLGKIYLVDRSGNIWQKDYTQDMLVPLETAIAGLEERVLPNPNLTLTYQ